MAKNSSEKSTPSGKFLEAQQTRIDARLHGIPISSGLGEYVVVDKSEPHNYLNQVELDIPKNITDKHGTIIGRSETRLGLEAPSSLKRALQTVYEAYNEAETDDERVAILSSELLGLPAMQVLTPSQFAELMKYVDYLKESEHTKPIPAIIEQAAAISIRKIIKDSRRARHIGESVSGRHKGDDVDNDSMPSRRDLRVDA